MTMLIPATNNVLEALEARNATIKTGCRNGFCGECRCKLVKGDIQYKEEPIGFVKAGEFLPCIAKTSGSIEVGFYD